MFECLGMEDDLHQLNQGKDESVQDFIRRFSDGRNMISDIFHRSVIIAMKRGIKDRDLLATHKILVVKEAC